MQPFIRFEEGQLRFRFVGQLHCTMETLDFWTLHRQLGECYQLNVEAMQDGDAKQPKSECINMITAQLQSIMCVEWCMKAILWTMDTFQMLRRLINYPKSASLQFSSLG